MAKGAINILGNYPIHQQITTIITNVVNAIRILWSNEMNNSVN